MIKSQVIFKIILESILFRNKENHTKVLVKFRHEEVKKVLVKMEYSGIKISDIYVQAGTVLKVKNTKPWIMCRLDKKQESE